MEAHSSDVWPEPDAKRKFLGVNSHMSVSLGFASMPLIIIPLGIFLWANKHSGEPFLRLHSAEAINFQISFFLYEVLLATILWAFSIMAQGIISETLAILLILIMAVVGSVFTLSCAIGAAIDAIVGAKTRYPLTIRFIS